MKNTEETVKALEAVIETAQAQIKKLQSQPEGKKVIGKEELREMKNNGDELWADAAYDNIIKAEISPVLYNTLVDVGQLFTTKENCEAFIAYQKAVANLMYACKPFLTEEYNRAYSPCLSGQETEACGEVESVPKFLWVKGQEKAFEIAEAHKEDLKVYLNYKWEL